MKKNDRDNYGAKSEGERHYCEDYDMAWDEYQDKDNTRNNGGKAHGDERSKIARTRRRLKEAEALLAATSSDEDKDKDQDHGFGFSAVAFETTTMKTMEPGFENTVYYPVFPDNTVQSGQNCIIQ